MSSGLASPQKTTPSLTDFRCWPPTSEGPNPWCHYHHHQVCIADNCSSSLDHVLVLLDTLTALRLKVSQKHMTSSQSVRSIWLARPWYCMRWVWICLQAYRLPLTCFDCHALASVRQNKLPSLEATLVRNYDPPTVVHCCTLSLC